MKLLVGLGNPGPKYENTRHNAGFLILDQIIEKNGIAWSGQKFSSHFASGKIEGVTCACLKPQIYMNLSGRAVREAQKFYKLKAEEVIVFHDDIDMDFGSVKSRVGGGGHGGHNGIRSIAEETGSAGFSRIKLGVGRPAGKVLSVTDWVLGPFEDEELEELAGTILDQVYSRLKSILLS